MNVKNTTLLISFIASFLAPFMISAVNIAVPSINVEFQAEALKLSWISTAYLLAAAVFLLPVGRIADIYGRKKIFTLGIIIYTLCALLLANASNADEFIFFRFIEGIGAAMILSTSVAILTTVFPPHERGKALGITVSAVYIGLSLGPFLGGYLTQEYGWRSVFYVNIPIGLLAVALILWKLKDEWADARGEKFDFTGALIYFIAFAAIIHATETPNLEGIISLIIGLAIGTFFLIREKKTEYPMLDVHLLQNNRLFLFSNISALINYSATYMVAFLLSLYLQYVKGMTPEAAGLVLIAQPVIQAIFSPLAGRLSDKIEPRLVASAGMILTVIGLSMLAVINANTETSHITLSLIILGLGFALFSAPNTNAVMGAIEKKQYGVGSAILATMRLTGQMLSTGIIMTLFAIYLPNTTITPDKHPIFLTTIQTAYTIAAVLCLLGVITSLARGKNNPTLTV
jgi:EmrB/QacA subfamily drug resistance transporter